MRDYLYVWHDPELQFVVASGIEFRDVVPYLKSQGGTVLIDHQSEIATCDAAASAFGFVHASDLAKLAAEDIYSWGNFVWADYAFPTFPLISDAETAELLFFAHKAKPLRVTIPCLRNHFLGYAHDDGWYLKLYYSRWEHVESLLGMMVPATLGNLDLLELKQGTHGAWLCDGEATPEERTHDIDKVLNRRL